MRFRPWFVMIGATALLGAVAVERLHGQDKEPAGANARLVVDYGGPTGLTGAFSGNNQEFVSLSLAPLTIRTFSAATGDCLRVVRVNGLATTHQDSCFAPNLQWLAYCSGHAVYLIGTRDGQVDKVLTGHTDVVTRAAFSADGKYLATCSWDKTARIWNLATGQAEKIFTIGEGPTRVLFSPDGSQLAVGHSGLAKNTVRRVPLATEFFDMATAALQFRLVKKRIVAWGPQADTFFVEDEDEPGKSVLVPKIKLVSKTGAVIVSTGEWQLIVNGDRTRYVGSEGVFNTATGKLAMPLPTSQGSLLAISPNGQFIAVWARADDRFASIKIIHLADGKLLSTLAPPALPNPVTQPAWSRDGKSITWAEGAKSLNLFELRFGPPLDRNDMQENVLEQGDIELEWSKGAVDLRSKLSITRQEKPLRFIDKIKKEVAEIPCRLEPCFLSKGEFESRFAVANTFELHLYTLAKNENVARLAATALPGYMTSNKFLTASPDGRLLMLASGTKMAILNSEAVWTGDKRFGYPNQNEPLLWIEMIGNDWILWTPEGYYAASPGAEKLVGWVAAVKKTRDELVAEGQTKKTLIFETSYFPLEAFRKQMYRPDVIQLLLAKGNLKDALDTANDVLKKQNKSVADGIADVEKLLPPTVKLQVLDKKDLPKIKLKASALAMVTGQPVTSLRLLVDGRPLPDGGCLQSFGAGKKEADVEWDMTVPPGKHQLTVLARCPDSSSRSNTVEVTAADPAQQRVLHLLAIGISDYEDSALKLGCAAKDAQDIAAHMQKCCKGELFHEVRGEVLLSAGASKTAILKQLAELRKQARPNDLVAIFFAGHAIKDRDQFYLLPADTKTADLARTAISGEELRKSLSEFPCQVLLMLDVCHSSEKLQGFRPAVDDITRYLTDDDCGVAVLCSAMAHEKSLDKAGNGLFTRAIVDALSRRKGVPYNTFDRTMYVHHLHAYVLDRISQQSGGRQHPFLTLPWSVESFPVVRFAAMGIGH